MYVYCLAVIINTYKPSSKNGISVKFKFVKASQSAFDLQQIILKMGE